MVSLKKQKFGGAAAALLLAVCLLAGCGLQAGPAPAASPQPDAPSSAEEAEPADAMVGGVRWYVPEA